MHCTRFPRPSGPLNGERQDRALCAPTSACLSGEIGHLGGLSGLISCMETCLNNASLASTRDFGHTLHAEIGAMSAAFLAHERALLVEMPQHLAAGVSQQLAFFSEVAVFRSAATAIQRKLLKLCEDHSANSRGGCFEQEHQRMVSDAFVSLEHSPLFDECERHLRANVGINQHSDKSTVSGVCASAMTVSFALPRNTQPTTYASDIPTLIQAENVRSPSYGQTFRSDWAQASRWASDGDLMFPFEL